MSPLLWGAGLGISFLWAYFPVLKSLASVWWNTEEYSHGFLVLPISMVILWRRRDVLAATNTAPSGWGTVLIVLSLLVYIFAYYAEINTISSFSMIPLLAGIVLYLYGFEMLKNVAFPLMFLIFMIPVPAQIFAQLTIPLQLFVSEVSSLLAASLGVPLLREGNVIHLPRQTLHVVQACSGLMSMISLWMLSAVIGYFALCSNGVRGLLFLLSTPIAVLVNVIRVFLLIIFFHHFGIDLTRGNLHTIYGVGIFALSIISVLLMTGIMAKWDTTPSEGSPSS
jgi:exosortase